MLSSRSILELQEAQVADVSCRHPRGRGRGLELASTRALVFVRRGCFVRSVAGNETMLDSTLAYCMNPGEVQRFDHPHVDGDDCTWITFEEGLFASLWGGEPTLPVTAIPSSPELDLEHRLLLAAARHEADPQELLEGAIALTASALARVDRERVDSGRPHTTRAQRALVDGAREMLAVEPQRSLTELASALSVSPHHLSRVFSAHVGHTIARHRMRLRTRTVLERLSGGERDLARLAAELGFADQSHLTRVLRSETKHTPAALRSALA